MLLPGKFSVHRRRASIYTQGVLTPCPFQANLYKLPREVIKECLVGFCRALQDRAAAAMTELKKPRIIMGWFHLRNGLSMFSARG
jgi:hypothetical protein